MKGQGFAVAPGAHILVGVKRSEVYRQFHNDTNVKISFVTQKSKECSIFFNEFNSGIECYDSNVYVRHGLSLLLIIVRRCFFFLSSPD